MQPRVHYARTDDGVNIAYFSVGRGPAIVFGSNIWGDASHYALPHLHTRKMTDGLVDRGWRVIRYDVRGFGASDREVVDLSLDGRVLDVLAVVDHAGLNRFAVAGVDLGAATALAFAAAHPNRVTHLVLLNGWASAKTRYVANPASRAMAGMGTAAQDEWESFTQALAKLATNIDDPRHTQQLAETLRRGTSPAVYAAFFSASHHIDLDACLPHLTMHVLVVHDTGFPFGSLEQCKYIASRVADAELVVIRADVEAEIAAIDAFLRSGEGARDTGDSSTPDTRGERGVRPAGLTPRELEVLRLIANGRTNREISMDLVLSVRTVARHITNIYGKIDVRSKAEATAYAIRHGLS